MKSSALPVCCAVLFAGCPIAPDFSVDAGPDAGTDAGELDDAGSVTGTVQATLSLSDSFSEQALTWTGTDLSTSTLDSPTQVTIRGINDTSGDFLLQIQDLSAGSSAGLWSQVSYTTPTAGDSWSCQNFLGANCTVGVTVVSYTGTTLIAAFSTQFPTDSADDSGAMNSGSINITFP